LFKLPGKLFQANILDATLTHMASRLSAIIASAHIYRIYEPVKLRLGRAAKDSQATKRNCHVIKLIATTAAGQSHQLLLFFGCFYAIISFMEIVGPISRHRWRTTGALAVLAGGAALGFHALTDSAEPELKSGIVINKEDVPAHKITTKIAVKTGRICTGQGQLKTCTDTTTDVPISVNVPEAWSVTIRNCDVTPPGATDCPQRDVNVTQAQFDEVQLGQRFTAPESEE
jgi:hypothetical protein